jgi:hypothetical protein
MSGWLDFVWQSNPGRKTERWLVVPNPKGNPADPLGEVKWFSHWRRYVFFPAQGKLFDAECLRAIAFFCERATAARKSARRAA